MKFGNRLFRLAHQTGQKLIENPRLIAAMETVVKNDGLDTRRELYSALLDATLVVPTPELPAEWSGPGNHIADGKTSFQIVALSGSGGKQVTPVFTDDAALRNWDPNISSLGFSARDYLSLVVQCPIQEVIINPFDPIRTMIRPGGTLTRWELEALAKGAIPQARPTT